MNKLSYADALMNVVPREHLSPSKIEELQNVIDSTLNKPVIINEASNFVMVTYWWGRGNLNKNTQKPCADNLEPGEKLSKKPVKYEDMIDTWVEKCVENKCNYLVVEYPRFAQAGGYQMAINAKPYFIKKALDLCDGRGVVYIDGDMLVHKYPAIFDMQQVDFMARGWNIDPRSTEEYLSEVCFDPIIFETSGGTMYFANSYMSRKLLDVWIAGINLKSNDGKADDRILSMEFMTKKMYLECSYIQLPIEYLWLTDNYTPCVVPGKKSKTHQYMYNYHFDPTNIIFEHPACLTSEESATDRGAANDRQPRFYSALIEGHVYCQNSGGSFYEYIFFENKTFVHTMYPYLTFISDEDELASLDKRFLKEDMPYYLVKYADKYGKFTPIAHKNLVASTELIRKYLALHHTGSKLLNSSALTSQMLHELTHTDRKTIVRIYKNPNEIAQIMSNLSMHNSVVYFPVEEHVMHKNTYDVDRHIEGIDLICVTTNPRDLKNPYNINAYPEFSKTEPMFMSCNNTVLQHLLAICETMDDFNKQFKSSNNFLTRIRCHFINVATQHEHVRRSTVKMLKA